MATISSANIVKFDGSENFGLWKRRVKDVLVQQGLVKELSGKQLEGMNATDWKDSKMRVASTIRMCLTDEVMYHVMDEESPITI